MPEITENTIRIPVDDHKFDEKSFKMITISESQGIQALIGKYADEPDGSTHVRTYIFDKSKWSVAEAEKWISEHKKPESSRRSFTESALRMSYEHGKPPRLEGYAVRYGLLSDNPMIGDPVYVKEKILPGAFRKSIESNDIRMYVDHNHTTEKLLGRKKAGTLQLHEDETGVFFNCVPPDTISGRDLITQIKTGNVSHMSFGYHPIPSKERWGKEGNFQVRNVEEGDLFEISAVDIPVWESSSVVVRCADPNILLVGGDVVFDITPEEEILKKRKAEDEQLFEQLELLKKQL